MSDNAAATGPPRLDKAEGALLALAAGDALGWPQEMPRNIQGDLRPQAQLEFRQWTRRSGGRFQPYEEPIHPGDYSDDTQLTLAVARCRTKYATSWWKALTRIEIPLWTLYERGGGGATKRAANAWIEGTPPWKSKRTDQVRRYFNAGGNGVAMRVLPHALFLAQDDTPAALVHDVLPRRIGYPRPSQSPDRRKRLRLCGMAAHSPNGNTSVRRAVADVDRGRFRVEQTARIRRPRVVVPGCRRGLPELICRHLGANHTRDARVARNRAARHPRRRHRRRSGGVERSGVFRAYQGRRNQ